MEFAEMRLYITGPVGSGKSTLARALSARTGVPCFALDDVVYEPASGQRQDNSKRPIRERDARFAKILSLPDFIMEDAGRVCFTDGMRAADCVVLLDLPPRVRRRRILLRWIKQNLGIEHCGYRPDLTMLRCMFRWSRNYENGADDLRARLSEFSGKLIVLRRPRDVRQWLNGFDGI